MAMEKSGAMKDRALALVVSGMEESHGMRGMYLKRSIQT